MEASACAIDRQFYRYTRANRAWQRGRSLYTRLTRIIIRSELNNCPFLCARLFFLFCLLVSFFATHFSLIELSAAEGKSFIKCHARAHSVCFDARIFAEKWPKSVPRGYKTEGVKMKKGINYVARARARNRLRKLTKLSSTCGWANIVLSSRTIAFFTQPRTGAKRCVKKGGDSVFFFFFFSSLLCRTPFFGLGNCVNVIRL